MLLHGSDAGVGVSSASRFVRPQRGASVMVSSPPKNEASEGTPVQHQNSATRCVRKSAEYACTLSLDASQDFSKPTHSRYFSRVDA